MSISQVRDYFRARIESVDSELREWPDGFNFENIPNNIFDKSYHVLINSVASTPLNDSFIDDLASINVRLFFKGFNDPQETIDYGLDVAHNLRVESVKPSNSMVGTNVKNVVCNSIVPEFVPSNDNAIIINLNFSVRLIFCAQE